MERFMRHGRLLLLALIALALLLPGAAAAQNQNGAQQPTTGERELLDQLGDARTYRNDATGKVNLIGAASRQDAINRPADLSANASPVAAARAHLSKYGALFGLRNQAQELRSEEADEAEQGRSVVHFQQVYQDVPVLGGELNVQLTDANELLVANGEVLPGVSLDTNPDVSAGEARETALTKIAKDHEVSAAALNATDPELWVYDPTLLDAPGPQLTRLVWRMDVTPAGLDHFKELVLVDAQRGNVALNFDQIHNAKNRETYDSNNTSALPGTLVCNESNPCTDPSFDNDVRLAHRYAGETYDFYAANHGRDSIDNAGMTLRSHADYCDPSSPCPYQNAFWDGTRMVYGDGFASADDVVGHELTHGVTEHESNLFYYYQSGAINESLSDVWGEFVDLTNTSGTDTATTRWQMGEDIPGIGAIRDMEDPGLFGDPDRMQSPNYTADIAEEDGGGVHSNSGVNNKAAFLMTDGATFNGVTVTGLGITKTAKIYYEVQTNMLTSAGDYNDLYGALQQACTNLAGTSGITAANCQEVKDAVNATQMNQTPAAAPATDAPVCATGESATNLFSDNLENTSSGNWQTTGTGWYYPQNTHPYADFDATYATSGSTNFFGDNRGVTSDHSIVKVTGVSIPAGKTTYLRFNHAYGFEDGFDGGVLEYTTNNGSTWNDAGSLIVNNGYNGTLSSSNPLGARQAFVSESNGYISSRVNLSSLSGQSVRFRFRIGEDSSIYNYGWFIDDVRVYTCATNVVDTTAPRVKRVVPAENATGIAPGANVSAFFSEAMRRGSINTNTIKLFKAGATTPLAAVVSYDASTKKAVLNPNANLQRGAKYKAVVTTGTKDLAGNRLDQNTTLSGNQQKTWFFTVRN